MQNACKSIECESNTIDDKQLHHGTADTNDSVEYSNRPRYNDINLNGARASYLLIIARILDY